MTCTPRARFCATVAGSCIARSWPSARARPRRSSKPPCRRPLRPNLRNLPVPKQEGVARPRVPDASRPGARHWCLGACRRITHASARSPVLAFGSRCIEQMVSMTSRVAAPRGTQDARSQLYGAPCPCLVLAHGRRSLELLIAIRGDVGACPARAGCDVSGAKATPAPLETEPQACMSGYLARTASNPRLGNIF